MSPRGCALPVLLVAAVLVVRADSSEDFLVPVERCQAEYRLLKAETGRLSARTVELEMSLARALEASGPVQLNENVYGVGTVGFHRNVLFALLCVMLAGVTAGLKVGLLSLDPKDMDIIVHTEEKDLPSDRERAKLHLDKAAAERVQPLIQNHHFLLVTLLLMHAISNEALPIFLDKVVPSWVAVLTSVTLVLFFGEIIPVAIFTSSAQLKLSSYFAGFVRFFQLLLWPVALPIAKILDYLLGTENKGRHTFAQVRAIVGIHSKLKGDVPEVVRFKCHDEFNMGVITTEIPHQFKDDTEVIFCGDEADGSRDCVLPLSTKLIADGTLYFVKPCAPVKSRKNSEPGITFQLFKNEDRHEASLIRFGPGELTSGAFKVVKRDEFKIMDGAMALTHMMCEEAMLPLDRVEMVDADAPLTLETFQQILDSGHSRLPLYSGVRHNVRGYLLAKDLIVVSPDKERTVGDLAHHELVLVRPDMPMLELLNKFQADKKHIALVTNLPDRVMLAWQEKEVVPPHVHMAGCITLEDIIEKLLQEDIEDEHDEIKTRMTSKNTDDRRAAAPADDTSARRISMACKYGAGFNRKRSPSVGQTLAVPLLSYTSP